MNQEKCPRRIKTQGSPCFYYIPDEDGGVGYCKLPQYFRCIEAAKAKAMRLSHSQVESWIKCPFAYYLYSIRGIKSKSRMGSVPLKAGSIWDKIVSEAFQHGEFHPKKSFEILNVESKKLDFDDRDRYKLKALVQAVLDLGVKPPKCEAQSEARYYVPGVVNILGYIDAKRGDGFFEFKLSGKPDWYDKLFNIHDQVGTYFMSDESLKKCAIIITRFPDLRKVKGKSDETDEEYGKRCRQDILSRPSHYFIGWNKTKKTWGRTYYRSEFDLSLLEKKFQYIGEDIKLAARRNFWPQRHGSCTSPFECEYYPLCVNGQAMNTELFGRRDDEKPVVNGIVVEEGE